MKKLEIVKTIAEVVVSVGVGAIMGNAVTSTTPVNTGRLKKLCIGLGSFVVSSMVTDKAVEYTGNKINDLASKFSSTIIHTEN